MPKGELPSDLTPDELDAMIEALAQEYDIPDHVYPPELVELNRIPGHIYGYNCGCKHDGLEMYKAGQKWRRRLIGELMRRPEWIAEWRAAQGINRRIRELCEHKNVFQPWECPPWRAPDELPERNDPDFMHLWSRSLPHAVRLRRQLIAELEASDR
jgi:hypothetical protein